MPRVFPSPVHHCVCFICKNVIFVQFRYTADGVFCNGGGLTVSDLIPGSETKQWCSYHTRQFWGHMFLGAFVKFQKTTASFVMCVRPSRTTRLPLDGFSWNLIFEYYSNIWEKLIFRQSLTRTTDTVHVDKGELLTLCRWIICRMRNISDKLCRENQNTFYVQYFFFRIWYRLWDKVEKYCRAGEPIDDNMAHAHCMLNN